MSRIVYVNGDFVTEDEAKISVFDRGFLFADGIYEVSSILEGRLIDNAAHLARLKRSADELKLDLPMSTDDIEKAMLELLEKNGVHEGALYLQVTRGAADRDFGFPVDAKPSLVMFTQEKNLINSPAAEKGIAVISVDDIRWGRRDIKTVQLLAPVLAKQAAVEAGANDAWLVEEGFVTEGSSNNAYIVKDGVIITRHLSNSILHGITRAAVLKLVEQEGLKLEERPFTMQEAYEADEAFVTSATTFVWPVVKIDDAVMSNGAPGEISMKLRKLYIEEALKR
ncbi:D-amino-acid transaminase [Curvivirga aplysinae]|uniref:D-amino-acid transaminase n=1 Tax=Curvivirga aplysinae TaxID=2529852 RepID=UPI0012BBAAF1|nr:D-amino-acid transaminase [Curvivirga aplysinae]MTI08960.1 D-amino-acid transaminase [Curvivirga aplysinae]